MFDIPVRANRNVARHVESMLNGQRRGFGAGANRERPAKGFAGHPRLIWPGEICVADDCVHGGCRHARRPVRRPAPIGAGRTLPGGRLRTSGKRTRNYRQKNQPGDYCHRLWGLRGSAVP